MTNSSKFIIGLEPVCVIRWDCKWCLRRNVFLHTSHWNCLMPEWISWCFLNVDDWLKRFWQILHEKGFFTSVNPHVFAKISFKSKGFWTNYALMQMLIYHFCLVCICINDIPRMFLLAGDICWRIHYQLSRRTLCLCAVY